MYFNLIDTIALQKKLPQKNSLFLKIFFGIPILKILILKKMLGMWLKGWLQGGFWKIFMCYYKFIQKKQLLVP